MDECIVLNSLRKFADNTLTQSILSSNSGYRYPRYPGNEMIEITFERLSFVFFGLPQY